MSIHKDIYCYSHLILTFTYVIWHICVKLLWHGFTIRMACNNIWLFYRGSGDSLLATCNVICLTIIFLGDSHNWLIYFICLTLEEKSATSGMVAPPSWKKDLSWCRLAWSQEGHFQNTLDAQGKTMLETRRWTGLQGEYPELLTKSQRDVLINIFREIRRRRRQTLSELFFKTTVQMDFVSNMIKLVIIGLHMRCHC